jgi:pantothenate kinase
MFSLATPLRGRGDAQFCSSCCYHSSSSSSARRRFLQRSRENRNIGNNNNNNRNENKNKNKVVCKFDYLPNSLLPSERFSAETTTFLDVARACAKRLRAAKELHPSGNKEKQIIVGIAGPPGGGKSTLAKQVLRQFRKLERKENNYGNKTEEEEDDENENENENENEHHQQQQSDNSNNNSAGFNIEIVPMDGYHYYRHQLEKMDNPQHAFAKRGAPFTFDSERFVNDIVNLRKTGSGSFPSFDHGKGDPVENDIRVDHKRHKIVLVEGNYLFLTEQPWSRLLDENCFDETWYVNCPVEEATKRVIDRHIRTGKTRETAELRAYSNDLVNAKLVDANKRFADVLIPNAKKFSRNS